MEQKTDLTHEFGSPPLHAQKEFDANAPEFIGSPDDNTPISDPGFQDNEFTPLSPSEGTAPEPSKHKKHRRTLLLQMAAVGLGIVVVTNSFGIDLLGSDALFSAQPTQNPSEPPAPEVSSGVLSLTMPGETDPIYLFRDGQTADQAISGVSYDPERNILTLSNCNAGSLYAFDMGRDFTLFLRGKNTLEHILVEGDPKYTNSLTVDGSLQAHLSVNPDQTHPIGLWVNAGNSPGILSVDWSIGMDVYGSETALVVSNDGTEGIETYPVSLLSGDCIRGRFSDSSGTDWSMSDRAGSQTPGTHAQFAATFELDVNVRNTIFQETTLYENAPYGNPFVDTHTTAGYDLITPNTPITITNTANSTPIYIYYCQFTRHDEPFPVEWAQDEEDLNSDTIPVVDLQGEYYSGGGIAYLATDGETLSWKWDFVINAEALPTDAVTLEQGESITFTLPDDGTNSIYLLNAKTYLPDLDYSYYIYVPFKF